MNYGRCQGGPYDGRKLVHHEPRCIEAIDVLTNRPVPGIQYRSTVVSAARPDCYFGEYFWDGKGWIWRTLPDVV